MKRTSKSLHLMVAWLCCTVCLVLFTGCTSTNYIPSKPSSYPAWQGKVVLLTNESGKQDVPGAEELGTVTVTTSWPWMSKAAHAQRWKQEAARHGANAVRWYGEGGRKDGIKTTVFSTAKAYRVEKIDGPGMEKYLATPLDYYNR